MHNQTTKASRGRLLEVDVARALAAIAVVALHAIGYSLTQDGVGSFAQHVDQGLILLLRFARQVFMFISGFALAYAYRHRVVHYGTFLLKRIWRVGLPYVVWSFIYLYVMNPQSLSVQAALQPILTGTAFYHLYYVMVSLQWYVIFLPVLAFARGLGRRAAVWVSLTVTLLYLGLAAWLTAGAPLPAWGSALAPLLAHRDQLLVSYIGYFLLGTIGGVHAEGLLGWLSQHVRLPAGAMAGILAFLLVDLIHDGPASFAYTVDVFRPALVLYGLAGVAVTLALSGYIVRTGGKLVDGLLALSRNSYTIYLAHPLVLFLVESHVLPELHWSNPLISVPLIVLGVMLPHLTAILLGKTPLAPLLLGQGSLWPWARPGHWAGAQGQAAGLSSKPETRSSVA